MAVPRELTEQLVVMEEGEVADRIRGAARYYRLSISEVCRMAIRRGLRPTLERLEQSRPVPGDIASYDEAVAAARAVREGEAL